MTWPDGGHGKEIERIEHHLPSGAKQVLLVGQTTGIPPQYVAVQVDVNGVVATSGGGGGAAGTISLPTVPTLNVIVTNVVSVTFPTINAVVNTSGGSGGGGGFQYQWGATGFSGVTGNLMLAWRNDALAATPVAADQQFSPLSVDSVGRLRNNPSYSAVESGAHVVGVTPPIVNLIAGVRHDADTALTDQTDEHAVFLFNDLQHLKVSAQGNIDHHSPDSGRPVKIGGKAKTSAPAAVSNNDRVDAYFDEFGRQHFILDSATFPTLNIQLFQTVTTTQGTLNVFLGSQVLSITVPTLNAVVNVGAGGGGTVSLPTIPTLNAVIGGMVAHDTTFTGINPVPIGGYASVATTTAVSADGDMVRGWFDRFGRLVTIAGHPDPPSPKKVNIGDGISSASTAIEALPNPPSGQRYYLQKVKMIATAGDSAMFMNLLEGTLGTNNWDLMTIRGPGTVDSDIFVPWYKMPLDTALWFKLGPAVSAVKASTARLEVQYFTAP